MKAQAIIPLLQLKPLQGEPLFSIQTLECLYESEYSYNAPAHSHDHFELIWITQGCGICWMDLCSHRFSANSVFCIRPGEVHRLQAENDDRLEGFTISFHKGFLDSDEHEFDAAGATYLFQLFSAGHGIPVPEENATRMVALALEMMSEFSQCASLRMQVLKRLLRLFFIYLVRNLETSLWVTKQTREKELAEQFISLLERNYRQIKMVSEYAKLLFITPNYLSEVIKKVTGISAGQHIRKRIALEAKRMGRYSDSCMKEIADDLGFIDSAHFSKFFKAVSGINFSDFKKEDAAALQML